MFTRPEGLTDDDVRDAVRHGWGVCTKAVEYAAVGFGSCHWRVVAEDIRWFVTADDLTTKRRTPTESYEQPLRRLVAALSTARELRDAAMAFVVAPERTTSGDVVHLVRDRFAVALYPFIDAVSHPFGPYPTRAERLAVLELVAALHQAPRATADVDDFVIRHRDELVTALDDPGPWDTGPFGEPARALLARHASSVARLLDHFDRLVAGARERRERFVLTHGEPHPANTLQTDHGVLLIDWDTALIAPPERDLWMLADEDPEILDDYEARTHVTPSREALELYRLAWDLAEISIYIAQFGAPHHATTDTEHAFDGLTRHLDPQRWPAVR